MFQPARRRRAKRPRALAAENSAGAPHRHRDDGRG